jgi:hypothetical protein
MLLPHIDGRFVLIGLLRPPVIDEENRRINNMLRIMEDFVGGQELFPVPSRIW